MKDAQHCRYSRHHCCSSQYACASPIIDPNTFYDRTLFESMSGSLWMSLANFTPPPPCPRLTNASTIGPIRRLSSSLAFPHARLRPTIMYVTVPQSPARPNRPNCLFFFLFFPFVLNGNCGHGTAIAYHQSAPPSPSIVDKKNKNLQNE